MRRRLIPFTAVLSCLVLIVAACGDENGDTADDVRDELEDVAGDVREGAEDVVDDVDDAVTGDETVTIENSTFSPEEVTIGTDDSVTFRNEDSTTHAVVSGTPDAPTDDFDETIDAGDSEDIDFDEAGVYDYFCSIHTSMQGTVIVE